MKRTIIAATLLLAACSAPAGAPVAHSVPKQPDTKHCADLMARALASPDAPVDGVMACLDSVQTDAANASGIYDDADFQRLVSSQPPVYNTATYCGRDHAGAYIYALASADGTATARAAVKTNPSDGLVQAIQSTDGSGCPKGLR